jgi:hypothetical protein
MTEQPTLRNLRTAPSLRGTAPIDVAAIVRKLTDTATDLASAAAVAAQLPFAEVYKQVLAEFFVHARGVAPTTAEMDARTAKWRVRVRLYDMRQPDEPEADSDPDLPPGHDGAKICHGLPGVAEWLLELVADYHGEQCGGMDLMTLRHRLKSLRPTLSRRGGNAVWRVPYVCSRGEWSARCDVVRVND